VKGGGVQFISRGGISDSDNQTLRKKAQYYRSSREKRTALGLHTEEFRARKKASKGREKKSFAIMLMKENY